jgi:hypothetical protein
MPESCSIAQPAENGAIGGSACMPALSLSKFMLDPAEVAALRQQHDLSLEQLMRALVPPAALLARAPTSAFPVGCGCCYLLPCLTLVLSSHA